MTTILFKLTGAPGATFAHIVMSIEQTLNHDSRRMHLEYTYTVVRLFLPVSLWLTNVIATSVIAFKTWMLYRAFKAYEFQNSTRVKVSPPTTPQQERDAERRRLQAQRVLNSPEHRRTPQSQGRGPPIPFLLHQTPPQNNYRLPSVPPPPPSQNDDDPFVFEPVQHNGQAFQLTPGIAAQLRALPPLQPVRGRRANIEPLPLLSQNALRALAAAAPAHPVYPGRVNHNAQEYDDELPQSPGHGTPDEEIIHRDHNIQVDRIHAQEDEQHQEEAQNLNNHEHEIHQVPQVELCIS
ncbi:hypothetical protein D9757_013108 [Collybiopsis confluens]|uniref:Uncharacterized protein n=1 Tax=Collybiopsis confluens TaxID=2823264 RepID=A0A8H5CYI0_9AGAR|nr:hypothetical protein D9757_013108 [Collybiopsis confluens]